MFTSNTTVREPLDVLRVLFAYRLRWIVPMVVMTLAALVYVLVRQPTWEASQALIMRKPSHRADENPGKFGDANELKTTQETVVELSKSRTVLIAALKHVGPPAVRETSEAWPTDKEIAGLKARVKITPPGGAELGSTEIFYLKVRSSDPQRAVALAGAIANGLGRRFVQLLIDKAHGMIAESEKTVALAQADLEQSTKRLTRLETRVGTDLSELRILHDTPAGTSDLRQKLVEVENELRRAETTRRDSVRLLTLLTEARHDDSRLVSLPSRLLDSHDVLRRQIEGLSAARLRTAALLGSRSANHPLVAAAKAEEAEVLGNLRGQLESAVKIAAVEVDLRSGHVDALSRQAADTRSRLEQLAGMRAGYANLIAETQNHAQLLQDARRQLADAGASAATAGHAALVARIDAPDAGIHPIGPGRSIIVLGAMLGGLLTGLAIVFVTVESTPAGGAARHGFLVPDCRSKTHARAQSIALFTNEDRSPGLSLKQALYRVASPVRVGAMAELQRAGRYPSKSRHRR